MNLKPVKLGKNLELKHIPFSQLIIPHTKYPDSAMQRSNSHHCNQQNFTKDDVTSTKKSIASKTLKRDDLNILKHSIGRFGLLKPFQIAQIPESLVSFYGKGKYFIIDGCKRYLAIRELLKLPTEEEEQLRKDGLRTHSGHYAIEMAEIHAVEKFAKLSIVDYVLIPCLIYPYKTYLEMLRHSIEAKRLGVKPSNADLKLAEKMRQEGSLDLELEDLSQLWETNRQIEKERQAIEKTLQQIRDRIKDSPSHSTSKYSVNNPFYESTMHKNAITHHLKIDQTKTEKPVIEDI